MKSRSVLVLLFVLGTAVFGLLSWPTTAQAAPTKLEARWFIEMAFPNDQPVANMTIEIYRESRSGAPVLYLSQVYPVTCQQVGSVEISNNIAIFDGSGYFECSMPNFQDKVAALTRGELKVPDSCTCKLAYGVADLMFSQTSGNPIFAMPELQFSAPVQSASVANYQLMVNGAIAESETFSPNGNIQNGMGQLQQQGTGYLPEFSVDGVNLGSHPAFIGGQLKVPTNQTTFYVGYNPDNGDVLVGKLFSFLMDPGCVGHGGI
ncbi:MAG: hypothetical protein WAS33_04650 [Candidatus Promineifilaceae bacterium]|nr:hypothetical protein [Anaerolineaceae bacterium]